MNIKEIELKFEPFSNPFSDGIEKIFTINKTDSKGSFLNESDVVSNNLFLQLINKIDSGINKVQLNQLFMINGLQGFTFDFFKYYWLSDNNEHPYDYTELHLAGTNLYKTEGIDSLFVNEMNEIKSIEQLRWGFLKLYTDSLLIFGNITLGYNNLSSKNENELKAFFESHKFKTETIKRRGHCIDFETIDIAERHLISEMACKNYDDNYENKDLLEKFLVERFNTFAEQEDTPAWINDLLDENYKPEKGKSEKRFLDYQKVKKKNLKEEEERKELEEIEGKRDIAPDKKISATKLSKKGLLFKNISEIKQSTDETKKHFLKARSKALRNTKLYLSLVDDMDVYVATSMRDDTDFEKMANTCIEIFGTKSKPTSLKKYNLRYFDPTMSAATGHDDKGLIECLMVKCAKVLIYTSADRDSYGKDAEAAMALSSGKPVIFYCDKEWREAFFKDVHPLTKLINFKTGVANGAMVVSSIKDITFLLERLFENKMRYNLVKENNGTFKLKEVSSDSTIRLQSNDLLLDKVFWNYFERHINGK